MLYPAPLRDLLLELSSTDLFRAKWSERIHGEWINALSKNRSDIPLERLQKLRQIMNASVMDAVVADFECLEMGLELPDPDDRHVLAAAIKGKADAIVTFNTKDFPGKYVSNFELEVLHPDDFLKFQFDFDQAIVVQAAHECRARLQTPKKTAAEYLATLERQALPKIAAELKRFELMI